MGLSVNTLMTPEDCYKKTGVLLYCWPALEETSSSTRMTLKSMALLYHLVLNMYSSQCIMPCDGSGPGVSPATAVIAAGL